MRFRSAVGRRRKTRVLAAVASADRLRQSVCPVAEVLEERVLMAAAVKLGRSGYSGTLSSDPATRQQQLICDPIEPAAGSTSVEFDPKMVRLTGFQAGPGYALLPYIEVVDPAAPGGTRLAPLDEYFRNQLVATGYVQVKYQLDPTKGAPGQITPPRTNVILDEVGVDGVDTYALLFQPLPEVPPTAEIKYRVFAAAPNTHSGNAGDFLTINDGTSNTITFDQLAPADITTAPDAGSIAGRVLSDTTDDGFETADDTPIAGATVYLDINHNGQRETAEPSADTDENGNYLFLDVKPGTYDVRPITPAGYFSPPSYPKELPLTVGVAAGRRTRGVDFGFTAPASLSGVVYGDLDSDGAREKGELGLPNALVYIDANGNGAFDSLTERSDVSDSSGRWSFTGLRKGTYTVRFNPPVGFTRTGPVNFVYTRTLNPGDDATGLNFGAHGELNLSITKTDGSATAVPGRDVIYTITVSNPTTIGRIPTATAIGARVVDNFSSAFTQVTWTATFTGSGSTGNASGSGPINELITLAPGGTAVYTVAATVSPGATGTLTNTASVTAPGTVVETAPANNTDTDTDTLTPQADVRLALSDDPDPVYPGGTITYHYTVTDAGPSDAQGVSITAPVPAGTTFDSAGAPAGWSVTAPPAGGTGTVTFTRPTLGASDVAGLFMIVRLGATVTPGATVSHTASVSAPTADPVPGNNSATATTAVVARPPRATQVFVNGTGWSSAFRQFLAASGLGEQAFGYDVGAGAASLGILSWVNLNQVSIRFDVPANVGLADLVVRGVAVPTYAIGNFNYDPGTNTATWTLAQPLPAERVTLDLNGDAGGVTDFSGQSLLDGESANNALASGNGAPGGDFRFRLNVLPGDADRSGAVDAGDLVKIRNRGGTTPANPGTPPNNDYSAFFDVNGSAAIDAGDLVLVRNRGGTALPPPPAAAAAATLSGPAPLFSARRVLGGGADELSALLE